MISNEQRLDYISTIAQAMGVPFEGELHAAYLARAVSSVPDEQKERLEIIFSEIVQGVKDAGLEARLPVELGNTSLNEINPGNHELLLGSKAIVPLTYATSDGRGWEMGFAYGKKLIVPVVLPDQKINIPSLRLPFQIPVVYEDQGALSEMLAELSSYQIHFGELDGEQTVIGSKADDSFYLVDLRKEAQKYMEVIPYKMG